MPKRKTTAKAAERRRRAVELREAGASTRAIADAVGVDPRTVRRDLEAGHAEPPPRVKGRDRKSYAARSMSRQVKPEQPSELAPEPAPAHADPLAAQLADLRALYEAAKASHARLSASGDDIGALRASERIERLGYRLMNLEFVLRARDLTRDAPPA
jgi:hypothetical protein